METRACTGCEQVKPIERFNFQPSKGRYRAQCKDCRRDYLKSRRKVKGSSEHQIIWFQGLAADLKKRAIKSNFPFELSGKDLRALWNQQEAKCALSGLPLHMNGTGTGSVEFNSPSVDRIDHKQGYVPGNIRFLAHCVNAFRGRMTDSQMFEIAARLQGGIPKA